MDYQKIGDFITQQRKEHKLTQAKLAEKLFISEKTISKWEKGHGVPDTATLPILCEIFNISINELLCGEKIDTENNQRNEKLLLDMAQELEIKNKMIWKNMWIIITISMLALLISIAIAAFAIPEGIWQLVLILCSCVIFLIPCFYALKLEITIGVYKCKNCNHEIKPTYKQALWAMHRGTTRYLKCPNCKKRSWCKKVLK